MNLRFHSFIFPLHFQILCQGRVNFKMYEIVFRIL
jgi:hypothetical protein